MSHLRGINIPHLKHTSDDIPIRMPIPDIVIIPMAMHIGVPCEMIVKKGDYVKVGQPIGNPTKFVGAPIHSSVSGTVTGAMKMQLFNGVFDAIIIETDKEQAIWEGIEKPTVTDTESFVKAVRESGLVGLGGAGFPTSVKLTVKEGVSVDYLIVNGAECEPYLTSDNTTMTVDTDYLIKGIQLVKKYIGVKNVIIGIENNKPKAIKLLKEREKEVEGMKVMSLPAVYPQGGEKVLIHNTTGRIVPAGKLPLDAGCIVMNVTSLAFLAKYMETGMPLVEKCVTVDGSAVAHPCKVIAPIGTLIKDVIAAAGGYKVNPKKILMGGPMMGIALPNDEKPIVKNTNGILAFAEEDAYLPNESECINCGRCVAVCPLGLMPNRITKALERSDTEELERLQVRLCMECGSCTYVCPAKREIVLKNKLAKSLLARK